MVYFQECTSRLSFQIVICMISHAEVRSVGPKGTNNEKFSKDIKKRIPFSIYISSYQLE